MFASDNCCWTVQCLSHCPLLLGVQSVCTCPINTIGSISVRVCSFRQVSNPTNSVHGVRRGQCQSSVILLVGRSVRLSQKVRYNSCSSPHVSKVMMYKNTKWDRSQRLRIETLHTRIQGADLVASRNEHTNTRNAGERAGKSRPHRCIHRRKPTSRQSSPHLRMTPSLSERRQLYTLSSLVFETQYHLLQNNYSY